MIKNKLSNLINKHQEKITDEVRNYIGASLIGSSCLRQIWYEFKGFESEGVSAKTRRTWNIGKELEGLILNWLEGCGLEIARVWWGLQCDSVPELKGHVDAVLIKNDSPDSILEVKTAKDASFKIFINKGLKIWQPKYYSQVQAYMGMSGIHSAYILVLNKDNSDISDELVAFDEGFYLSLVEKAKMIAASKIEPPKISGSPLWFECRKCKFSKVCHK